MPAAKSEPTFEAAAVLEQVSDAVAVVDRDWRCLYFNAAFERLVGRDRQQLLGKTCWELAPAALGTDFEEQFRKAMAQQVPLVFEAFYPRLNIWVEARAFPSPCTLTILFHDITAQKQAEETHRASEERLRDLLETTSDWVWEVDINATYTYVSPKIRDVLGYEPSEVLGKTPFDLMPPAEAQRVAAIFAPIVAAHKPFSCLPNTNLHKDGHALVLETSGVPIFGRDGTFCGYRGIDRDVTARQQAHEDLQRAKEALEVASRAKDHFLAVLSHELRTPLAPVLTTTQIMEQDPALSPEQREAMSMIRRNVELEARLIDDLLDLTRITRGKLELNFTTVDLHERVRHVLTMCEHDIAGKQLKLSVTMDAASHHVSADPARLQQILWNLLKNAVKFTPAGGSITITTGNPGGEHVVLRVHDTGMGIEPEILPRLFDAFEQGGKAVTRQFGGLGLGLAISKGLVDRHGGTLVAESQGPGTGATFTLTLKTVASPQSEPLCHDGPVSLRTLAAGRRVLLVEDHPDTARAMSTVLTRYGFAVSLAYSVAEAVSLAKGTRFELLISDIGLPDGSGLDVLRQVAAISPIKAIAISGFGMQQDIRNSLDAGFLAHLSKPVTLATLERVLTEVLAGPRPEPQSP